MNQQENFTSVCVQVDCSSLFNWSQEVKYNFISSNLQGQARWGFEPVEGVPARDSWVENRWSFKFPFNPNYPVFYDLEVSISCEHLLPATETPSPIKS